MCLWCLLLSSLSRITANQGFYILGLYYASPTFASTMQNSVPAITFIMASALRYIAFLKSYRTPRPTSMLLYPLSQIMYFLLLFPHRLEQVSFLRRDGLAKILGTIVSVGGATIITLYKGPPLVGGSTSAEETGDASSEKMLNWTWGCIYLLGHCLSWAGWMVLQVSLITNSIQSTKQTEIAPKCYKSYKWTQSCISNHMVEGNVSFILC